MRKYLLILFLSLASPALADTLINTTQLEINPTATDAVSGVAFVTLSKDGTVWGDNITYPAVITDWLWLEGVNIVYAKFIDAAGNIGPVVSAQITIDTLPPEGGVISIRVINSSE